MNALNRLLGLLVFLILLAAALVTLGITVGWLVVPEVQQIWSYPPIVEIVRDVTRLEGTVHAYVMGGAVVAALVALLGLKAELSPPPRRERLLALPVEGPGRTEVAYSTLDELAERSAGRVAGVERARARVEPRKGKLAVRCRALVSPFAELATAGSAIERTVATDLGRLTGLPIDGVRVRTAVQDPRARRRVR